MADPRLARLASTLNATGFPRLALMTDDDRLPDPRTAALSMPGGSLLVVRAKDKRRRMEVAITLARIAREHGLFLLIADDPELAAHFGADGVHFPESRASLLAHWRALRPHWLLTTAAHSLWALARARQLGADAVFLSPVFPTRSHPGRAALTPVRLRLMTELVEVPVYALGGVDGFTARRLEGAGIAGFAAIGAFAEKPRA